MTFNCATAGRSARRSSSGFTLIELMIVAAIIAILSAMAMYAYGSYVARGKRADARNQLLQAAQFMQQFYSANDSFMQDRASPPNPVLGQIPQALKQSPADSTPIYRLTMDPSPTNMTYTLVMTPVNPGSMATDSCGAFSVDSKGVRKISTSNDTAKRDTCWK